MMHNAEWANKPATKIHISPRRWYICGVMPSDSLLPFSDSPRRVLNLQSLEEKHLMSDIDRNIQKLSHTQWGTNELIMFIGLPVRTMPSYTCGILHFHDDRSYSSHTAVSVSIQWNNTVLNTPRERLFPFFLVMIWSKVKPVMELNYFFIFNSRHLCTCI